MTTHSSSSAWLEAHTLSDRTWPPLYPHRSPLTVDRKTNALLSVAVGYYLGEPVSGAQRMLPQSIKRPDCVAT
jgi:hypothetical protein